MMWYNSYANMPIFTLKRTIMFNSLEKIPKYNPRLYSLNILLVTLIGLVGGFLEFYCLRLDN